MYDPIALLPSAPLNVWPAALAFLAGGIANAIGHPTIRASFVRLGFPGWWCRVTAALEIVAALSLLVPETRVIGIALGGSIMVVAIAAILAHRLYGHLPPPILFVLLLTLAAIGQSV
jgi:DoxX-like family